MTVPNLQTNFFHSIYYDWYSIIRSGITKREATIEKGAF